MLGWWLSCMGGGGLLPHSVGLVAVPSPGSAWFGARSVPPVPAQPVVGLSLPLLLLLWLLVLLVLVALMV